MSNDIERAIISGATLGFLSAAAHSENFYMQGLLLGRNAANSPQCLEIVAALPYELKPSVLGDFQPTSELRVVGLYKCKKCADTNRKFSVNDYKLMSKDFVDLFFLIEANDDLLTSHKLFQVRPSIAGDRGAKYVRQISLTVMSIDSSIGRLYDAKKMQIGGVIDELARKTCSELENDAIEKLSTAVGTLSNAMGNVYENIAPEHLIKTESIVQNDLSGFHRNPNGRAIAGSELPNIEHFDPFSPKNKGRKVRPSKYY